MRNKEIQQVMLGFIFLTGIFVWIGWKIDFQVGLLMLVACLCLGSLFLIFNKKRYRKIRELSDQIDLVLHHEEYLFIDDLAEGELSILQSEIAKMTARIREQNEALRKEKRALADSLADIAHQLRTPLTSVNLSLSLLMENSEASRRRQLGREIELLLVQVDWLLTSLLKLSKLDAGVVEFQPTTVLLKEFLSEALRPFLIPMELHDVTLMIATDSTSEILGDISWLSEAVQNIVKNCLESVSDGGEIRIQGTTTPLFTEIRIQDDGAGFDQETLVHLFDRFYSSKQKNSFGIGLSLSQLIIARHGGTLKAKNAPDGGALFLIRLPK